MWNRLYHILLFLFIVETSLPAQLTVSGFVKEIHSGEPLIGVTIFEPAGNKSATSNNYGFFALNMDYPQDDSIRLLTFLPGYNTDTFTVHAQNLPEQLVLLLSPLSLELPEVIVRPETFATGKNELSSTTIKQVPAFLGEKDLIKTLQLLPGVVRGSDANAGLFVRGGGADQNLIILDDVPLYNVSHVFGFFSMFNGDAVKNASFFKGAFPAQYGGRLSSVLDITLKDGTEERLHGEGGIGILSSRITLEGPLKRNKGTFMVAGRRTYADLLLAPVLALSPDNGKVRAHFYDFNAKAKWILSPKDQLFWGLYGGQDRFGGTAVSTGGGGSPTEDIFDLRWGSYLSSLRWNRVWNAKAFSNLTFFGSRYRYSVLQSSRYEDGRGVRETRKEVLSQVFDLGIKGDLYLYPAINTQVQTGFTVYNHRFRPNDLALRSPDDNFQSQNLIQSIAFPALETAWYGQIIQAFLGNKVQVEAGARAGFYRQGVQNYTSLEPRLSLRWKWKSNVGFQAAYSRTNQFLHLVSYSGLLLPTDVWLPSTGLIRPQSADQFSAGLALKKKSWKLEADVFYKKMNRIIAYREGVDFLQLGFDQINPVAVNFEEAVTQGNGNAYGAEIGCYKAEGKLTGWASYSWMQARHTFAALNGGKSFFAPHDRRHSLNIAGNYAFSEKIKAGFVWIFASGSPMPLARGLSTIQPHFYPQPVEFRLFEGRDGFRMSDYHRLDFSMQFYKQKKRFLRWWEFGVFNTYARKNPITYDISEQQVGEQFRPVFQKYWLFSAVPSASYNVKF